MVGIPYLGTQIMVDNSEHEQGNAKQTLTYRKWVQTKGTPWHLTWSHPLTTSSPVYPTPMKFPLPPNKHAHILLAKAEHPWFSFWFLAQTSPPSHLTQLFSPSTSTPACHTPIESPLPHNKPACILLAKAKHPWFSFWWLCQTSPPNALPNCVLAAPQSQYTLPQ